MLKIQLKEAKRWYKYETEIETMNTKQEAPKYS